MAHADGQRWEFGSLRVSGPHKHVRGTSVKWEVLAVDATLEDAASKWFSSKAKAQAYIDQLVCGASPVDPLAQEGNSRVAQHHAEELGRPGPAPPTLDGRHTRSQGLAGQPKDAATAPFNLKAVTEALTDAGLDPFVELARALQETVTVLQADGSPRLGPDGQPIRRLVMGARDRASVLIELAQYYTPKLKAVEVKVEDKRQLTEEQLNERIAAILERGEKTSAHATIVTPGAGQ